MPRLENLQSLRFIAAFAVALYHAPNLYERAGGALDFKPSVSVGFVGVDIFFVISGFVMWITASGKSGAAAAMTFGLRRAARIELS